MATPATPDTTLNDTQQQILSYLRAQCDTKTYFKSRIIGDELGFSSKEVGTNMTPLVEGEFDDIEIERWGYSSSTTWCVTPA